MRQAVIQVLRRNERMMFQSTSSPAPWLRRITRALGAIAAIAVATTFAEPTAIAEVMGPDWTPLVVSLVIVPDAIFATYDIFHASRDNPPSATWARVETYVAAPQFVIGALITAPSKGKVFAVGLAATTLPAILTTHGVYTTSTPYGANAAYPLVILSVLDAMLGTYDLVALANGDKPDDVYAYCELLGTAPQVLFGLSYASQTPGSAAAALALSVVPAALTLHGAIVLGVFGSRQPPSAPPAARALSSVSIAPLTIPSAYGLSARGFF